jgi:hypothetical protein
MRIPFFASATAKRLNTGGMPEQSGYFIVYAESSSAVTRIARLPALAGSALSEKNCITGSRIGNLARVGHPQRCCHLGHSYPPIQA